MKKYIYALFFIFLTTLSFAHTSYYDGIKKIEMEVFRNNELIGYSNYFFENKNNTLIVKNYTKFKVKLLGATIFSISSEATEKYIDDKLIYFKSITFQNDKEKYVNLHYDQNLNKLIIDGSSFKGKASIDCVIGNWWNHKLLKAKKQISPLSGSVKDQLITYIGEEKIEINGKNYLADHFKLISKKELSDDKKLDFDIWLNKKNNLIIRVSYKRLGEWEYRLKSFE
tara:strand:- start:1346 stop:2023 length:678 start_codon:yes stop_codon:yes gene_type:complete